MEPVYLLGLGPLRGAAANREGAIVGKDTLRRAVHLPEALEAMRELDMERRWTLGSPGNVAQGSPIRRAAVPAVVLRSECEETCHA